MASSLIHLAIGALLRDEVTDFHRFSLGEVMPDAGCGAHHSAHMPKIICGGAKETFDLTLFCEEFSSELLSDDLYLGYYLHLVQDMIHREAVYKKHGFDPRKPGYLDALYADYRALNPYLVRKYSLTMPDIPDTLDISLMARYDFDLPALRGRIADNFADCAEGDGTVFTREIADSIIEDSVALCRREIDALRRGGSVIDEDSLAWERKK